MAPVEIFSVQGMVILRARGSELLIIPEHVAKLKELGKTQAFTEYFLKEALVNRPARKLFEAWLRKDAGVWNRLYQVIANQTPVEGADTKSETSSAKE